MLTPLPRFYLITGNTALLQQLLPQGVQMVQLRIKQMPSALLRAELRRARDCCRAYGTQLVVNDHWQLALELGIDYVHLGQEDLQQADLPVLRRAGVRFGLSTHDEDELEHALALAPGYVALGPIWPTRLKAMRWAPQGLQRLRQWKARVGAVPLVAIGGITAERLPQVLAAGADSAAVVTDIALAADPLARTRQWLDVTGASPARSAADMPVRT
jgi:thiamine-phosphate pyrophosphorylase